MEGVQLMKQVAILGGTFDPVHLGHLIIAEQAYNFFELDQIIFLPSGKPPHKNDNKISSGRHRLEMVKIAVADNPHFSYSDWELGQQGKTYTADSLRYFKNSGVADKFFFIIGADSLIDIYKWKETKFLLKHANFIVARRPGYSLKNILSDERYKPYRKYLHFMDSQLIDISSSRIRQLVKQDKSIRYLTIPEVINYINKNNLY